VADKLILETTFLIDLERELGQGIEGPTHDFLSAHHASQLHITFTVAGELAAGVSLDRRVMWEQFIAPLRLLPYTPDVCWEYGQAFKFLQANGLLIGTNDLWIAATAIVHGIPLVTRNKRHFQRVPRLEVLGY
jgi:predicted nucleic acid-binding protein